MLYTGYRYAWDQRTVGLFLAAFGVCGMIVSGTLVRPIVTWLGERRTLLLGQALGAAGFAAYGLAPVSALLWLGVPLHALWGLANPAVQGLMTRRVAPNEQGRLQGANSSLRGIAGLIGPGLFTLTFARAIGPDRAVHFPGAPLLLAAGLVFGALLVAWRVTAEEGVGG